MRRLLLSLTILALTVAVSGAAKPLSSADSINTGGSVSGRILDTDGHGAQGVILRALHLPDSAVVNGTASDSLGMYRISGLPMGRYVLVYSALGYNGGRLPFTLSPQQPNASIAPVTLTGSDLMLQEAVVTGVATPVTVEGDTVSYNADAYKTAEGAMTEDLIEQIPGAEIADDGKIKINGKEYNKILIDGKEFFGDDPSATLKNLPANIIKRIRTYDRKSAQARITGIDDGIENNVIDIEIKPNLFKGLVGSAGASAGNHDRYNTQLNVNRFRKDRHVALVGSMNNVNNPVFAERGSGAANYSRSSRPGLTASKSAGLTFAKEKKKEYEVSGNVRYNYTNGEEMSDRRSETAYNDSTFRYGQGENHSDRRRHELNMNMKLEWQPDTLTRIDFRPNVSYSKTDNWGTTHSASQSWNGLASSDTIDINDISGRTTSDSHSWSESLSLLVYRRLNPRGRSLTLNTSFGYSDAQGNNDSRHIAHYFLRPRRNRNYMRYWDSNSHSLNYSVGLAYNEPLFKHTYLQLRYSYSYHHARSERYGYEYDYLTQDTTLIADAIDWTSVPIDTTLSNVYQNTYRSHSININMRHTTPKLNLSYGVHLNPRTNQTDYIFGQKMDRGLLTQHLMNWSPNLHFKYRFTKRNTFDLVYTGNSDEPNIDELQEIIDKSNTSNIRYGNPSLKPGFNHNVRANLNLYSEKTHRSLVTNWNYTNVQNATSNMTFNESSTGVRVSKLMNVNGRWSTSGNINFNTPLDSSMRWNVSTNSALSYNEGTNYNSTPLTRDMLHAAGITTDFQDISFNDIDRLQPYALRNHTQTLRLVQSASLQYRLGHFSWRLSGSINYYKVQNSINKAAERETFDYAIRANLQSDLPFDMQISTNINYLSRHGYSSNIVKNRAIWNAQLTKRLFAHDAGLLSLQVFDLLHQRTNVNRSISGLTITDTHSMVLGSYFLASFQYRINTMRRGQRGQRWQRGSQQRQRNGYNRPQSGSRPPGNRTNGSRNGRK